MSSTTTVIAEDLEANRNKNVQPSVFYNFIYFIILYFSCYFYVTETLYQLKKTKMMERIMTVCQKASYSYIVKLHFHLDLVLGYMRPWLFLIKYI